MKEYGDLDEKETKRHLAEILRSISDPIEIYKKKLNNIRTQIKEDKEASYCL